MVEFAEPTKGKKSALDSSTGSSTGPSDLEDAVHGGSLPTRESDRKLSKKKRKHRSKDGGADEVDGDRSLSKRRNSLHKAARDPRDEPDGKQRKKIKADKAEGTVTRSPSPVIDFDGLSRPSMDKPHEGFGMTANRNRSRHP